MDASFGQFIANCSTILPNALDGSYTLLHVESNEGLIVTLDLYNGLLQREGPPGVENEQPSFLQISNLPKMRL